MPGGVVLQSASESCWKGVLGERGELFGIAYPRTTGRQQTRPGTDRTDDLCVRAAGRALRSRATLRVQRRDMSDAAHEETEAAFNRH